MKTLAQYARGITENAQNKTPEQWYQYYREIYPDITPQEARTLYPLFLQATDPAHTARERNAALIEYRRLLDPLTKRNPPKRETELFT